MAIAIVSVILLLVGHAASQVSYQSCFTPNGVRGLCQPVRSCSSVLKILQGNLTPQVRDFLERSQCVAGQPWVCCPIATSSTIPTREPPRPLTVVEDKLPKAPNCGIDSPNRIFGGEETKIDEYPWLVQLEYTKPGNKKGFHCGGSLINNRYVLTAAHCISKVPANWHLNSVRLGEWDTSTLQDCDDSYINEQVCNNPPVDVSVEQRIVHENYEPNSKNQFNDIALLRLSKKVQFTDYIQPICLPVESSLRNKDLSGMSLDVAGWGKTETSSSSTRKLKVAINAYSTADCQRIYRASNIQITENQICAGGETGRDSCNGDSGGPLMKYYEKGTTPHYFLAGIVSYGPKNCGTKDIPGVYTKPAKYIDWIQSNIRD